MTITDHILVGGMIRVSDYFHLITLGWGWSSSKKNSEENQFIASHWKHESSVVNFMGYSW